MNLEVKKSYQGYKKNDIVKITNDIIIDNTKFVAETSFRIENFPIKTKRGNILVFSLVLDAKENKRERFVMGYTTHSGEQIRTYIQNISKI